MYFANVQDSKDVIRDTERLIIQTKADLYAEALKVKGKTMTPEMEEAIESLCRKQWDEFVMQTAAKGIPERLTRLLEFTRKSDVGKYCKTLQLEDDDLLLLIYNCPQVGFTHRIKTRDSVPQHLQLSRDDIAEMKRGETKEFLKKTSGMRRERKIVMVHLFERDDQWHCFYFSWSDLAAGDAAHWKHGSHIHYVSYLWSNLLSTRIMQSFDKRTAHIPGSMHVRFRTNAPHAPDLSVDTPLSG